MRESLFSGCNRYPAERLEAFGGWSLPPWIDEPQVELQRAREGGGYFDGSPWTKILVTGVEGLDLLQRVSSNDLRGLDSGRLRPTLLVTEKGRLIDLLHVIPLDLDRTLLVGTPGKGEVIQWLEKYTILEEITYTDVTHHMPMILTVGHEAESRLLSCLDISVSSGESGTKEVGGLEILCGRSVGLPFDISFALQLKGVVADFWALLTSNPDRLKPCGFRSFEYARIRAGVPLAQELREEYNPYDIGLRGAISFSKGCYIGQEVIARLDTYDKIRREPILLSLKGRLLGEGTIDVLKGDEKIGEITSSCDSGDEAGYPAIAVVERGRCRVGDEMKVRGRGESVEGAVCGSLDGGGRWG